MTAVALSTMWAQQERFATDFVAFARVARSAGYDGIEVSHSTGPEGLAALLLQEVLPVLSLHAPAPRVPARGGSNGGLNLAATDEEERREAVAHTLRTVAHAASVGARYVVVHLGGLPAMLPAERRLRALYHAGQIASATADAARAEARRERAGAVAPHLAAARRSLAEIARAAAARGVVIGLENRLHYHEIPSAEETMALLADYPPHEVGYWHDVGHAEVQGRLGLLDPRAVLTALAPRLIGAHLHDVRGITDHRAPGNGDVDWSYIATALPPGAARTLEIDQREPEPLLAEALRVLRAHGVLTPAGAQPAP
jgi:sugar phosphate isomerase/epimerase